MLRFEKATYLSLLFWFILSERLSYSLWGWDVLLFPEFKDIVSVLFYNFIKLIILLYTFLVTSFSRYKEYIIWRILFSKFLDVLPAFTFRTAIGYFWNICNILSPSPCFASLVALFTILKINNLLSLFVKFSNLLYFA